MDRAWCGLSAAWFMGDGDDAAIDMNIAGQAGAAGALSAATAAIRALATRYLTGMSAPKAASNRCASHCVNTRTRADTCRFCGYSTDTGMGAGGRCGTRP